MSDSILEDRRRSLEEAFFRAESERLRGQIRSKEEAEEAADSLAAASGITDVEVLGRLAGLGIRAETLAALTLVPLVEVAWADGKMEANERDAILRGAESSGIPSDSPSFGLLQLWIEDRPAPDLIQSWKAYIGALCEELSADQRWHLEEKIVGRARAVAESAGGILGLGSKISRVEEETLTEMEKAFGSK